MRILVVGAAGATGRLVVSRAREAGHDVVALTRSGDQLSPSTLVTEIAGDARDPDAIARAADGMDVIVSTLGVRSRGTTTLIAEATAALIEGAHRANVGRVVMLSAFGVGASLVKASPLFRLLLGGGKSVIADKADGEKLLRASDLRWTIAYPVLLTDKPAAGQFAAVDLDALVKLTGVPQISRADVADFLVDAATDPRWIDTTVVLTPQKSVR